MAGSILWMSGFELGASTASVTEFSTSTGSNTISADYAYGGTGLGLRYAASAGTSGYYVNNVLNVVNGAYSGGAKSTIAAGCMFRYASLPEDNGGYERLLSFFNGTQYYYKLGVSHGGFLQLIVGHTTGVVVYTSASQEVFENTWHYLCCYYNNTVAGSAADVSLYLDGILLYSGIVEPTPSTVNVLQGVSWGKRVPGNNGAFILDLDHMYVASDLTVAIAGQDDINLYERRPKILALPLVSDSTPQDWTDGSGAPYYANLNDVPANETTYLRENDSTGGRKFNITPLNSTYQHHKIAAVSTGFRCKSASTGSGTVTFSCANRGAAIPNAFATTTSSAYRLALYNGYNAGVGGFTYADLQDCSIQIDQTNAADIYLYDVFINVLMFEPLATPVEPTRSVSFDAGLKFTVPKSSNGEFWSKRLPRVMNNDIAVDLATIGNTVTVTPSYVMDLSEYDDADGTDGFFVGVCFQNVETGVPSSTGSTVRAGIYYKNLTAGDPTEFTGRREIHLYNATSNWWDIVPGNYGTKTYTDVLAVEDSFSITITKESVSTYTLTVTSDFGDPLSYELDDDVLDLGDGWLGDHLKFVGFGVGITNTLPQTKNVTCTLTNFTISGTELTKQACSDDDFGSNDPPTTMLPYVLDIDSKTHWNNDFAISRAINQWQFNTDHELVVPQPLTVSGETIIYPDQYASINGSNFSYGRTKCVDSIVDSKIISLAFKALTGNVYCGIVIGGIPNFFDRFWAIVVDISNYYIGYVRHYKIGSGHSVVGDWSLLGTKPAGWDNNWHRLVVKVESASGSYNISAQIDPTTDFGEGDITRTITLGDYDFVTGGLTEQTTGLPQLDRYHDGSPGFFAYGGLNRVAEFTISDIEEETIVTPNKTPWLEI